jgi:peptidoglycan/LPS O-acetylase OafA/YrhL
LGGDLDMTRYRLVDICRGLAALSVLIWHYQHFFYSTAGVGFSSTNRPVQPFYGMLWPFYEHGGLAVEFFWVLSGFVFAATYLGRPFDGVSFFVNRFARLYPLHLITLVLVALLQYLSWRLVGHFQIYPQNDAYHFGLNLLMAQWWGLQRGFSFNAPTWSISVEVVIYAAFLGCLPGLKKAPLPRATVCAAGSLLLIVAGYDYFLVQCAMFFFLGVACYTLLERSVWAALGVSILAIFGFAISRWFHQGATLYEMAMFFSSLILLASSLDTMIKIRNARLDWFGDATYGTYLLHIPIQITVITTLEFVGVSRSDIAVQAWFFLAFILTVFGLAVVVFRWIEKPAQNLVKMLFGHSRRFSALVWPEN